jgi:hypothetical protein
MLFSRFETLLIALALIVPESLRSWAKSLEPYPAVILPAGASTIRVKRGTVPMSRLFLTAKKSKDASPQQLERAAETKRWMKAKLAAQGFETHQLRVMSEKMRIALPSGKRSNSHVSRKKAYDLD